MYEIDYQKGVAKFIEVVPLCHLCHNFIHDGRLQNLLDMGKIHQYKYIQVIQHGERVLKQAGLNRESHREREAEIERLIANGKIADWGKWRLRIGRKLYPPIFKTYEEWRAHYLAEGGTSED